MPGPSSCRRYRSNDTGLVVVETTYNSSDSSSEGYTTAFFGTSYSGSSPSSSSSESQYRSFRASPAPIDVIPPPSYDEAEAAETMRRNLNTSVLQEAILSSFTPTPPIEISQLGAEAPSQNVGGSQTDFFREFWEQFDEPPSYEEAVKEMSVDYRDQLVDPESQIRIHHSSSCHLQNFQGCQEDIDILPPPPDDAESGEAESQEEPGGSVFQHFFNRFRRFLIKICDWCCYNICVVIFMLLLVALIVNAHTH